MIFFPLWLLLTWGFACLGFVGLWLGLTIREIREENKIHTVIDKLPKGDQHGTD